mmetsp:Transcript_17776/g.50893  ORF Transcript_17776/g.50893 Transcript_17776/m.50893 type:complete len:256 (-) Transcript_17776:201-968(-)
MALIVSRAWLGGPSRTHLPGDRWKWRLGRGAMGSGTAPGAPSTSAEDSSTSHDIVELNVGGTLYTATRQTLTKDANSMLGAMFAERNRPLCKDVQGRVFLDRDGQLFRYILRYLRDSQLVLDSSFDQLEALLQEAHYFALDGLIRTLESLRQEREGALERAEERALESQTRGNEALVRALARYLDHESARRAESTNRWRGKERAETMESTASDASESSFFSDASSSLSAAFHGATQSATAPATALNPAWFRSEDF